MLVIEVDPTGQARSTVSVRASTRDAEDRALLAWQRIRDLVDQIDAALRDGCEKTPRESSEQAGAI